MANVYLKFGSSIKGDVTLSGHEGWIAVDSLHWGISRNVDTSIGGGSNRVKGHPSITDLTMSKYMDNSSPGLFNNLLTDQSGQQAQIDVCSSSDDIYCSYILDNCLVSNISTSSGGDKPVETITLNFTRFTVVYTPRDAQGSPGSPMRQGYDVAQGVAV